MWTYGYEKRKEEPHNFFGKGILQLGSTILKRTKMFIMNDLVLIKIGYRNTQYIIVYRCRIFEIVIFRQLSTHLNL